MRLELRPHRRGARDLADDALSTPRAVRNRARRSARVTGPIHVLAHVDGLPLSICSGNHLETTLLRESRDGSDEIGASIAEGCEVVSNRKTGRANAIRGAGKAGEQGHFQDALPELHRR